MSADKAQQTQDFRETMIEFVGASKERHAATMLRFDGVDKRIDRVDTRIDGIERRLSAGNGCVAGARHQAQLDEHRRAINGLERPLRRAVLIGGGTAVGGGGLLLVLAEWLKKLLAGG